MLEKFIRKILPVDGFTSSVFTLLSGTTLALGVAYLAQPILTRLYTPSSFGLFDAFLSIVTILVPFASFRYEDALMLPEEDEEASHVLGLSIVLILGASVLSCGLILAGPSLSEWFDTPELYKWLYWVPPVLVAIRMSKIFELWLTRKKRFSPISAGQASQSGLIAGTRIVMGSSGTPTGLFTGYLWGHIATAIGFGFLVIKREGKKFLQGFSRAGMLSVLKRYRCFPVFSMPATLLSALITRLPALLLLYFFTDAVVGYFSRSYTLFAVPLSLLGAAISQVFFVEGVEAYRNNELPKFIRKVHIQLILIGLFPTLAIMITGPQVFGFILGQEWTTSGRYLQYIAPWLYLASIASPLTRAFDILERQRLDLVTSLIMFFIQTIAFIAGGLSGDPLTCLIYVSIGGSIGRLLQLVVIFSIGGVSFSSILSDYSTPLLVAIPFLALLFYINSLDSPLWITVALVLSGISYLAVSIRTIYK